MYLNIYVYVSKHKYIYIYTYIYMYLCIYIYTFDHVSPSCPSTPGLFPLKPVPCVNRLSLLLCLSFLRSGHAVTARKSLPNAVTAIRFRIRSPSGDRSELRSLSTRPSLAHRNKETLHGLTEGLGFGRDRDLRERLNSCINI